MEIHRYEMAETANQNKQVENGVVEFYFLDAVQDGAGCISHPPCYQPKQAIWRQIIDQGFNGENNDPPHEHIHQSGNQVVFAGEKQF